MNNIFKLSRSQRMPHQMHSWPCLIRYSATLLAAAMVCLCLEGCSNRETVRVQLQARPAPHEPLTCLEIEAQVAGPVIGLRYKWFAGSGECEPQESGLPRTIFKFPEGVRQDRVSVEIWREGERVAQSDIKVKFDDAQARLGQQQPPSVKIEITKVPPYERGGPDSSNHIGGTVSGELQPGAQVAIYARAFGSWFIQPKDRSLHPINPDNTWGSWTHTGNKYAALLVRPEFEPLARLDMLPESNSLVLACTVVDGVRINAATNAVPSSH